MKDEPIKAPKSNTKLRKKGVVAFWANFQNPLRLWLATYNYTSIKSPVIDCK